MTPGTSGYKPRDAYRALLLAFGPENTASAVQSPRYVTLATECQPNPLLACTALDTELPAQCPAAGQVRPKCLATGKKASVPHLSLTGNLSPALGF